MAYNKHIRIYSCWNMACFRLFSPILVVEYWQVYFPMLYSGVEDWSTLKSWSRFKTLLGVAPEKRKRSEWWASTVFIFTGGSVYGSHSSFRKRKGCRQSRPYFVVVMMRRDRLIFEGDRWYISAPHHSRRNSRDIGSRWSPTSFRHEECLRKRGQQFFESLQVRKAQDFFFEEWGRKVGAAERGLLKQVLFVETSLLYPSFSTNF